MARLKIEVPTQIIAQVNIGVRITDINYGNHVGNDSFVAIIHEARVQWLSQHNFTELDICGAGLIMGDLSIVFKNESFYGDQLQINISVSDISACGFNLFYQLSTQRNGNTILLATARTGMVCYDYETKKVTAIPVELMEILHQVI